MENVRGGYKLIEYRLKHGLPRVVRHVLDRP